MTITSSSYLKSVFTAFALFVFADMAWHGFLMADFYESRLRAINGVPSSNDVPFFILAYALISAFVMTYFILATAKEKTTSESALHGGLLGLLVGGGINFVNHSLLLKWDLSVLAVDTLWGIAVGAIIGAAVLSVSKTK